jgi:hypothetical protein
MHLDENGEIRGDRRSAHGKIKSNRPGVASFAVFVAEMISTHSGGNRRPIVDANGLSVAHATSAV